MLYENAARQIRVLRAMSRLTQKELAERIGVTPNYISAVETGIRKPSLEFYRDIANYFKVTYDYLFFDSLDNKDNGHLNTLMLKMKYLNEKEQRYILKMIDDYIEFKEN